MKKYQILLPVMAALWLMGCDQTETKTEVEQPKPTAEALFAQAAEAEQKGDKAQCLNLLRQAAEAGSDVACLRMGELSLSGAEGLQKDAREAVKWFEKAAAAGNARAKFCLATCLDTGAGVEKNPKRAFELWKESAEQGYDRSLMMTGLAYANGYGEVAKDTAMALQYYAKAAQAGNVDACYYLGVAYDTGDGVEKDNAKAVEFVRKAADTGHALACDFMGKAYMLGYGGCQRDYAAAARYLVKAADKNVPDSLVNLAKLLLNGQGVEKNAQLATECLQRAVDRHHVEAMCILGACYDAGVGVEKNAVKAIELWKVAGEAKNARSLYYLGRCLSIGHATEKNEGKAAQLYAAAAALGELDAYYQYGLCLLNGTGVEKNEKTGAAYVAHAANSGHLPSIVELGRCYDEGRGVDQDKDKARDLWRLAVSHGNKEAEELLTATTQPAPEPEAPVAEDPSEAEPTAVDTTSTEPPKTQKPKANTTKRRTTTPRKGRK